MQRGRRGFSSGRLAAEPAGGLEWHRLDVKNYRHDGGGY